MGSSPARYVALLGLIALAAFTVHVALSPHKGSTALHPGTHVPPFAAPYAIGGPPGEVDIATHANDGLAGRVPACRERGPRILNICELYERGPVVLALFFKAGSCPAVLHEMQQLAPAFPHVALAAVAVKDDGSSTASLVRAKGLTFPVGVDAEGRLGQVYAMVSCPQVTFIYPGGIVQGPALLKTPSPATLRARMQALVVASRARGWRPGRT